MDGGEARNPRSGGDHGGDRGSGGAAAAKGFSSDYLDMPWKPFDPLAKYPVLLNLVEMLGT